LTTCSEDEVALKPLTEDFDMQLLSSIKLIAADLDKTFYPNGMGDATSDPNPEAIDEFEKNIEAFMEFMKNRGLAIPVTGNSPALAQGKFDRSQVEWKVEDHPGVFCNGALVLGAEGRVEYSAPVPVAVMRKLQEWVASCDGLFEFEGIKYPFAVNCMTKSKLLYLAPKKTSLESQQIAVAWASMQLTTSEVAEPECDWEAFPAYQVNILLKNKDDLLKEHPALEEESAQRIDKIQRALLDNLETAVGKLNDASCLGEHVLSPWCETRIVLRGADKGQSLNRFIHSKSVKDKIGLVNVGKHVMVAGNAADDLAMFTEWPQIDDFNGEVLQKTARPAIRVIMPDAEDGTLLKESSLSNKIHEVLAAILQTQATTDVPSSSSPEATTEAPCSTAPEEATANPRAKTAASAKKVEKSVGAVTASKATTTPRAKTAASAKKVDKTVGTVTASKAPAVRKASPMRSVTSTGASTVVNNGDTKASGKISPRGTVAAPRPTPKAATRAMTPTRKAAEDTDSKSASGTVKLTRKASPRRSPTTATASASSPRVAGNTSNSNSQAAKPSDSSTAVRMSKSASTAKMGDVNTAPPSSPRRSPSMTRLAQLAQTPKREVTQASTTAAETPSRTDETKTPRKSSTQVPNSERLSQLAQVHKPKSLTSTELEALEIQKACEEARRLREKNTRAVQRQAAARAMAAGQEATTEAPQPNSTSGNGRRSPLRTRAVANVEAVATKTKPSAKAVDVAKENQAVDVTVAKPVAGKKSTASATQRPSKPLAKRPGTVVAATRA
jgi:hydroxymethylpyrimidine pyrophosphatase-like HAD family hydrolase